MKKSTLAVAALLSTLSVATIVPVSYADTSDTQQTCAPACGAATSGDTSTDDTTTSPCTPACGAAAPTSE